VLEEDRDVLLTFYDFPAEHWMHIRTTNPIESTFATVRLRTNRTKVVIPDGHADDDLQADPVGEQNWRALNALRFCRMSSKEFSSWTVRRRTPLDYGNPQD